MKSWGIAITVLGSATVLLLGFIATQLLQKPAPLPDAEAEAAAAPGALPEAPVAPRAEDDRLEIQRIELERERLAVETLRLKAQIQSDLAQFELALRAQSADAAVEVAAAGDAGDPATAELADAEPPAMQNFAPDPIAFEEFREPLEPFGDWFESPDYGAVWSPHSSYIDDGWAPYTNGSWGYSDYGWSWASNEPFGSVCYHYGRWIRLGGRGWCWVPGRDWAPAWVSWRTCDTHVAWAPLPPSARWNRGLGIGDWVDGYCGIGPTSYCFVERADFGAPDCRRVLVDRRNNLDLIRRSKNVTRLSRSDRFVHNHGPDFDRACKLSSRPIPRLKIDPDKSERNRKSVAAGRRPGGKTHAPLEKLDRTRPDRGWAGPTKQKGDLLQLRKQMVAEARGSLIEREKVKPEVIARAKNGRSPAVNERPKAVAAAVRPPKAPSRTVDRNQKVKELPAVDRQEPGTTAAQARARIAQAKQAQESAAAAGLAAQEAQRKRQQADAAMLARRKADAAQQAARERQKVYEEQQRVVAAQAERDRERKMIAANEARAELARKSAEAQREASARQARAVAEEQARRKAEDDSRRRKDDQRRKAAAAAAQEQEDRRRKVETDRKRQEQAARDRQAAEKRRDDETRKARAREEQRRKATEDSRRKQAADAARAQEAQKQRAREDQRRKATEDSRRKQAADAARAQEAHKQRERDDQRRKATEDSRRKQAADAARAQEAHKQRERK